MQKSTIAITFPHIISRVYLRKANQISITSRFCVHGTLQINQSKNEERGAKFNFIVYSMS